MTPDIAALTLEQFAKTIDLDKRSQPSFQSAANSAMSCSGHLFFLHLAVDDFKRPFRIQFSNTLKLSCSRSSHYFTLLD